MYKTMVKQIKLTDKFTIFFLFIFNLPPTDLQNEDTKEEKKFENFSKFSDFYPQF